MMSEGKSRDFATCGATVTGVAGLVAALFFINHRENMVAGSLALIASSLAFGLLAIANSRR
jgi:hypothetical protein